MALVAQGTPVDYAHLGIAFHIPQGWMAEEVDGTVVMASEGTPGVIFLTTHEIKDMATLRANAMEGLSIEENVLLRPDGAAEDLRNDVVAVRYRGMVQLMPTRGYGIGMLNPHGEGLSIVALCAEELWSDALERTAQSIMRSTEFKKVQAGPEAQRWIQHLKGSRLSYFERYSSQGNGGSVGGGYSSEQRIDLCDGWFSIVGTSSVSMGGDAVSGHASGGKRGHGTWDVVPGPDGRQVLRLTHHDGERNMFTLEEREGKLHLNGVRWFRTTDGEHAPDCR